MILPLTAFAVSSNDPVVVMSCKKIAPPPFMWLHVNTLEQDLRKTKYNSVSDAKIDTVYAYSNPWDIIDIEFRLEKHSQDGYKLFLVETLFTDPVTYNVQNIFYKELQCEFGDGEDRFITCSDEQLRWNLEIDIEDVGFMGTTISSDFPKFLDIVPDGEATFRHRECSYSF